MSQKIESHSLDPSLNQSAMLNTDPAPHAAPLFRATLSPNHSLSQRGTLIILSFVGLVSLLTSLPFYFMGAWPVAGFFGVDVFLLWLAFRISHKKARAFEEIFLSRIETLWRKVSWRGDVKEARFNTCFVRLERQNEDEYGLGHLHLREGNRQIELATCLGGEEKAAFAKALQSALHQAKR